MSDNDETFDTAIVGMSVYCPGARDVRAFWRNLAEGVDSIIDAPPDIIEPFYFGAKDNSRPDLFYCHRGGFTDRALVDPVRFGILPKAAEGLDPDQVFSLLLVEEALHDAGVLEKGISMDNASIIIGRGNFSSEAQLRGAAIIRLAHELAQMLKFALPDISDEAVDKVMRAYQNSYGRYQGDTMMAMIPNLVASLVANQFNMHGPAYTVDAACASGIVALQHGIALLKSGKSDVILVGAMYPPQSAVFWSAFHLMGALSHKGQIAPFSQDADGLLIGQGGGFMVIKSLQRAIADNDRIYAVVKGTATGSDGGGHSVLITDANGQTKVLEEAWKNARMDPAQVAYVETHGTGTVVGDATELEALTRVFGDSSECEAYLGSVKSNIGHLMPAAGMMGLIKTALALYHRKIPPTLHCENPLKQMAKSRFEPAQTLMDWEETGLPLIAAVDSFGFGGINCHAVLTAYEEPESQAARYRADKRRAWMPDCLAIAAPTREALLSKFDPESFINQVNSLIGSPTDSHRLVIFSPTDERMELAAKIVKQGRPWLGRNDIWYTDKPLITQGGKVVFMFPGWEAWRAEHDSLVDALNLSCPEYLFLSDGAEDKMNIEQYASSMLIHAALKKTGIEADYYTGHSIGEWHAARTDGVLDESFDQMNQQFSENPSSILDLDKLDSMLAYKLVVVDGDSQSDKIVSLVDGLEGVSLITDNCPKQCVYCVIGEDPLDRFVRGLSAVGLMYHILPYSSAFHTPYAKLICHVPDSMISSVAVHAPRKPFWSAMSASEVVGQPESARDVVEGLILKPVMFRQTIENMYKEGQARVFIQVGAGSLNNFVDDTLAGLDFASIATATPLRNSMDQLRRVHALMFIMGGYADLTLMGMPKGYQISKSLYLLSKGSLLHTHLETLDEVMHDYITNKETLASQATEKVMADRFEAERLALAQTAAMMPAMPGPMPVNSRGLPRRGFTRDGSWPMPSMPGLVPQPPVPQQPPVGVATTPQPGVPTPARSAPGQSPPVQAPPVQPQSAPAAVSAPPAEPPAPPKAFVRRAGTRFEVPFDADLDMYPYVRDHSIVNQPADWPNKDDNYPVLPLTMTIELMAEIAQAQVPTLKVLQISSLMAMNFIPVAQPFHEHVTGFWKSDYTVALSLPGFIQMDVTLGEEFADPPLDFVEQVKKDLGPDIREPLPAAFQYTEYSFHRPRYWSLLESKRFAQNGFHNIEHQSEGKGALLDQMGQMVGLFLHLYAPENRVSFPIRIRSLTFYQDFHDQAGLFEGYCVVRQITDTFITADLVYTREGKVWAIARNWVNQRTGLDSEMWRVIMHPEREVVTKKIAEGVYWHTLNDIRGSAMYFPYLRYMTDDERTYAAAMASEDAVVGYVASRICLKDAVRSYLRHGQDDQLFPIEIATVKDEHGKPFVVRSRDGAPFDPPVEISIAHTGVRAVCAVSDHPVGVDLEKIEAKDSKFWNLVLTESEKALLATTSDTVEWAIRFWVAKEAYSKMIGTGLGGAPKKFEVTRIDGDDLYINDTKITTTIYDGDYVVGWTDTTKTGDLTHD